MPTDSRGRLIYILRYLQQNTDDLHEVTCAVLQASLAEAGYEVKDRRTIVSDVKKLKDCGYDIEVHESPGNDTTFAFVVMNLILRR